MYIKATFIFSGEIAKVTCESRVIGVIRFELKKKYIFETIHINIIDVVKTKTKAFFNGIEFFSSIKNEIFNK